MFVYIQIYVYIFHTQPLKYERHFSLPRCGILELDFTSLLKPQDIYPNIKAVTESEWTKFLDNVSDAESLFEIVQEFR